MTDVKRIVIWGAGKIGRGFVGEIFHDAGYHLTFVDNNQTFVENLCRQKEYTVYLYKSEHERSKRIISGYDALHIDETEAIHQALLKTSVMAVSLFPSAFEDFAKKIAAHIEYREKQKDAPPLNIIICANILHPATLLTTLIEERLSNAGKQYFSASVGLIESIVIRMAVKPEKSMIEKDPLVVLTNGYEKLLVDTHSFVSEVSDVSGLRFVNNFKAEEIRKIYTYNMVHAVVAYTGKMYGYETIAQAMGNKTIVSIVNGAIAEIKEALISEFGFTSQEMEMWNTEVLSNMANPILGDTIDRVGADPKRKLLSGERLVGAAILCRKHGIMPYYLSTAIACAYQYYNAEDISSVEIQDYLSYYTIREALAYYSNITDKPDLVAMITRAYNRIKTQRLDYILGELKKVTLIKKGYALGFQNEREFRGCAQCTIKALGELLDNPQPLLFKAASGFSGGIAITGDGSCGGYAGGVLFMGSYVGRRLEKLAQKDKEAQYTSFAMAQILHDRFLDAFGSVTCSDIHTTLFGRSYCLRTKAVRNEFEDAGGHGDACTSVIANATAWTVELLLEYGFIEAE